MKKYVISLIICLTVGLSGVFTACNNDVPTIDYQHESKYTADFSKLIEAIRSQTTTLEKKLELINQALNDVNASLKDKLNLIEVAVAEGVGTYKEYAEKIIEAINNLNLTQDAKLQTIYDILASNNASLELQLAAIEEAVKAGFGTYKEMAEALIKSINDLNASQAEKLQLIYDILKSELATLSQKVADVEAAIKAGFLDNQAALKALQDAIVAALANDQKDLSDRLKELNDALTAIKGSLDSNFKLSADAIATLTNELIEVLYNNQVSTNTKLANIEDAIKALSGTVTAEYDKVAELLKQIADAVEAGADYSEIIAAIKSLVPQPEPEPEPDPVPEGFVDLGITRAMVYGEDCENPKKRIVFAEKNLGATEASNPGYYFRWGELKGWRIFGDEAGDLTSSNCVQYDKNGEATGNAFKGFTEGSWALSGLTTVEDFAGKTNLTAGGITYGDAVTYYMGEGYKMMDETLGRAVWSRGNRDRWREEGIIDISIIVKAEGCWLTNNDTGAKILFPYGGYLNGRSRDYYATAGEWATVYQWTSTPEEGKSWMFYQVQNYGGKMENANRWEGRNIRAVAEIN